VLEEEEEEEDNEPQDDDDDEDEADVDNDSFGSDVHYDDMEDIEDEEEAEEEKKEAAAAADDGAGDGAAAPRPRRADRTVAPAVAPVGILRMLYSVIVPGARGTTSDWTPPQCPFAVTTQAADACAIRRRGTVPRFVHDLPRPYMLDVPSFECTRHRATRPSKPTGRHHSNLAVRFTAFHAAVAVRLCRACSADSFRRIPTDSD